MSNLIDDDGASAPPQAEESAFATFRRSFGPGLLWAATAIGVSHLVQATRAGATAGFALSGVILLALVLKYPFFDYGPRYAAATGMSLIEGYRRVGRWALWLFLAAILTVAIFAQASITLLAGHLIQYALGLEWNSTLAAALVYAICALILMAGRFRALELAVKVLIASLTLCTVLASILVLPHADFSSFSLTWPAGISFAFLLALMGWMPSDIAVSVYSSLWTIAKDHEVGSKASVRTARTDFFAAYALTSILAFAFVLLGSTVIFGAGASFASDGATFSMQLVSLYSAVIGEWVRPVIIVLVITTVFSTALTIIDAIPRVIDRTVNLIRLDDVDRTKDLDPGVVYWGALGILGLGVVSVLSLFRGSLTAMIDVATGIAFLMGPVFAYLNLRAVTSSDVPEEHRPGRAMLAYSYVGLAALSGIGIAFLYTYL